MPATRRRQSSQNGSSGSGPKRTRKKKGTEGYAPCGGLFDAAEGQRRQEAGTAQALSSARALTWTEMAELWLRERSEPFTSEDVIAAIGLPNGTAAANRNNAVGAWVRACARAGRIAKTGYDHCQRPESHGAIITVWRPAHRVFATV